MMRLSIAAAAMMAGWLFGAAPAFAQSCPVAGLTGASAGGRLSGTSERLRTRLPIKVLAIGSSTTAGIGGGSSGYAARLGPLLEARTRHRPIVVVASGVLGETASGAAGRLAQEIAIHAPDLVVWQLGTNDANFGVSPEAFRRSVGAGLAVLRQKRLDVVLVDPQFSRFAEGSNATAAKAAIIASEGQRAGVPVVRRYGTMERLARADRDSFGRLISWDGLHLSALGHACLAEQIAATIARAAGR